MSVYKYKDSNWEKQNAFQFINGSWTQISSKGGHIELDYIELSREQWINTDFALFADPYRHNWTMEYEIIPTAFYNYNAIWGTDDYTNTWFESWIYSDGRYAFRWGGSRYIPLTFQLNKSYKTYAEVTKGTDEAGNFRMTVNGGNQVVAVFKHTFELNNKIWFGHREDYGSFKLRYIIFKQASQVVLHLIPVLDSNNVPCMFDLVSEKYFYNAGTGTFGYGFKTE